MTKGARYFLITTVLFSLMEVFVKLVKTVPAYEIVCFRATVSLAICFVWLRRNNIPVFGTHYWLLLARGGVGTIALLLFFYALQNMPLASAVTLQNTSPIFTVLFATFIMREMPTVLQVILFAVAFAGVFMVKGFDPRITTMSMNAVLLSAMLSGLAYNLVRKLGGKEHPMVVVFYFPLVTVPTVGLYTAFHWYLPQGWEWLWLVLVGVCTHLAQVFLTKALQEEKAADVIHIKYLGIVFAALLGYGLFDEILGWESIVGMVIIVSSVYGATKLGSTSKTPS